MPSPVRGRTAGDEPVPGVDRVNAAIGRAPVLARPVLTVLSVILLPWLLAPICVVRGVRTMMATFYVAAFWSWVYLLICVNRLNASGTATVTQPHTVPGTWLLALLATPFLIAALAGSRPMSRWFIPCRTVAWSLLWPAPVAFFIVQASPQNAMFAVIAVWVIAAALIGWKAARGSQEAHMFGPDGPLAGRGANGAGPAAQDPPAPDGPAGGAPAAGAGRRTRAAGPGRRRPGRRAGRPA